MALADGGLAGVQQVLEASVPFDAVLMDMQMPDIDGPEATWRIRADGRFAGLPILAMTANASLADREAALAAGMNDHVAKPIDKERLVLCLLGHLGRSGAAGRAGNGSGRGRTGRGAGRYRRAFLAAALELIVQVLRRFVPDMQDLFAQLERQLGEGDVQGSAATLHTIKGSASTVGASARRPCQRAGAGPAPRRSLRGMEILAGIRLDELRTSVRCLPAPPAGDVRRRAGGVGELNPRRGGQSRQGFRRTRGSPASAAACRANNAMGVIRRYS